MGHATIDNATPLAVSVAYPSDESGRPLLVVLAQATYTIAPQRPLRLADVQVPPSLTGELWGDSPATSCWRVEPAFAFVKLATDVALVGHAQTTRGRGLVAEMFVTFRVGPLAKVARVVGDRSFVRSGNTITASRPTPFERMPLSYERAFGGWDRSSPDPKMHTSIAENPVGRGYAAPNAPFREGVALPNLEDPAAPLERFGQRLTPMGFGFVSSNWQPRATLSGTYDEAWSRDRMPLLPSDFDRRFFNAGARGLVANGYLRGDEAVVVEGSSPDGRLAFQLPGAPPPAIRVARTRDDDVELQVALDTVVVDTDAGNVLLLYRAMTPLRDGPHDVRAIEVKAAAPAPANTARSPWP